MSKIIRELEQRIVGRFVRDALAAGYNLAVSSDRGYDVDDGMLLGSRDYDAIMAEAFAADECHIFVQPADEPAVLEDETTGRERLYGAGPAIRRVNSIGYVYLVLGNGGYDVVSDYTTNLETLLAGAMEISDAYA